MQVPFRSILCPTDLSETGNRAVPLAIHLAADDGEIHLLHVGEPAFLGNPLYNQFVVGYVPTPEEREAGEDRVREQLRALEPEGGLPRGISLHLHVVHAISVSSAIEEEASRLGVEVVVMGTHGRTGLGRFVMGSVATEVVGKESLPVILVHEDAKGGA